jgi:hypothetical protein
MRKHDVFFIIGLVALVSPFFVSPVVLGFYEKANTDYGVLMSFLKFAVLATVGESIALRLRVGKYNQPGFGILPRAVVWGMLGMGIKMAFVIFAAGTPAFLRYLGIGVTPEVMRGAFSTLKLLGAFCISTSMNLIFAPVFMTIHKITDEHITRTGGKLRGLLQPIPFGDILSKLNWSVMWNFVFKKTIPLFWIPAHTITFLLPAQHQILFAALLGVVLGILLAFASLKSRAISPQPSSAQ